MKKFKILMLVMFFVVTLISTPGLFAGEKVVKSEKISKDAKTCYTCPMASCKTFSHKAGKCPKCGMALKKMDKKDCAKKCDAKKAHKKCTSKDHKKCCAKKVHKKCAKDCKKECCAKKDHKKLHAKKDHKKCAKDFKKECCTKKVVKKEVKK